MSKLLLGLDIGSSSIKASVVDAETGRSVVSAQSPSEELPMIAVKPGWAEQHPELWWEHAVNAIKLCLTKVDGGQVEAIGISYQMHGLVIVGKDHKPLRPSIIWCDSRAVEIGNHAFEKLGSQYSLEHLLNSPGNFTASKLRWVKQNEPDVFDKIEKLMLPGDYIALKLTGEIVTTDSGLSEGVFWDYPSKTISQRLIDYYQIHQSLIPPVKTVFSEQGRLRPDVASSLGLKSGISVSYRAGDQPNNAFSLNVLNEGETAATAGTSGVIYAVTSKNAFDPRSRVNTFVHVNNTSEHTSNGVLLCINGTGILNSWLRKTIRSGSASYDYKHMNQLASEISIGSDGLMMLPFGNGAERVLENKLIGSSLLGLDFNTHGQAHVFRAAQEGIVFALKYGFEVLQGMGLHTNVIRAGHANMFLSPIFREAFVNTIGAPLQLYNTDGATGAAIGAGVGAGLFSSMKDAFRGLQVIGEQQVDHHKQSAYLQAYEQWKIKLIRQLNNS